MQASLAPCPPEQTPSRLLYEATLMFSGMTAALPRQISEKLLQKDCASAAGQRERQKDAPRAHILQQRLLSVNTHEAFVGGSRHSAVFRWTILRQRQGGPIGAVNCFFHPHKLLVACGAPLSKHDPGQPSKQSNWAAASSQAASQHSQTTSCCASWICTPAGAGTAGGRSRQQSPGVQATAAGCRGAAGRQCCWLDRAAATGSSVLADAGWVPGSG